MGTALGCRFLAGYFFLVRGDDLVGFVHAAGGNAFVQARGNAGLQLAHVNIGNAVKAGKGHAQKLLVQAAVYGNLAVLADEVGRIVHVLVAGEARSGEDGDKRRYEERVECTALALFLALAHHAEALDVHDDGGGVVVPAGVECGGNQVVGTFLRGFRAAHDAGYLGVFEHGGNAVGAQQDTVARFHVQLVDVGLHVRVGADGARDNRAVGVNACLCFGKLAGLYHVGHKAVVAGKLLKASLVQQVGARIAHLGDYQALAFQDGGGKRGAHALAADALAGRLDNLEVRGNHGAGQRIAIGAGGCQLGQGVDGHLGGNLACFVAAHSVGNGEQRRGNHQAVLVVLAHMAYFRAASEERLRAWLVGGLALGACIALFWHVAAHLLHYWAYLTRMVTSPTVTLSPLRKVVGSVI